MPFLFSIHLICGFQDKFWSSTIPNNVTDSAHVTLELSIFSCGSNEGISSFLLRLWKMGYVAVFFVFFI